MRTAASALLALALALGGCQRDGPSPAGDTPFGVQPEQQPDPGAVRAPDFGDVPPLDPTPAVIEDGHQRITITVLERAFDPPSIALRAGSRTEITFIRTSADACGEEVVVPAYGVVTEPLPVNQPVVASFTPSEPGVVTFTCGEALQGRIIVSQ